MAAVKLVAGVGGSSESEAQVTADDQKKINRFARLNTRLEELKVDDKRKQSDLQNLNDAADELLLLDDSDTEGIPLKVGETFIEYSGESAQEKMEELKLRLEKEIAGISGQEDTIKAEMSKLKADLYGKFGSSINLEPEDD